MKAASRRAAALLLLVLVGIVLCSVGAAAGNEKRFPGAPFMNNLETVKVSKDHLTVIECDFRKGKCAYVHCNLKASNENRHDMCYRVCEPEWQWYYAYYVKHPAKPDWYDPFLGDHAVAQMCSTNDPNIAIRTREQATASRVHWERSWFSSAKPLVAPSDVPKFSRAAALDVPKAPSLNRALDFTKGELYVNECKRKNYQCERAECAVTPLDMRSSACFRVCDPTSAVRYTYQVASSAAYTWTVRTSAIPNLHAMCASVPERVLDKVHAYEAKYRRYKARRAISRLFHFKPVEPSKHALDRALIRSVNTVQPPPAKNNVSPAYQQPADTGVAKPFHAEALAPSCPRDMSREPGCQGIVEMGQGAALCVTGAGAMVGGMVQGSFAMARGFASAVGGATRTVLWDIPVALIQGATGDIGGPPAHYIVRKNFFRGWSGANMQVYQAGGPKHNVAVGHPMYKIKTEFTSDFHYKASVYKLFGMRLELGHMPRGCTGQDSQRVRVPTGTTETSLRLFSYAGAPRWSADLRWYNGYGHVTSGTLSGDTFLRVNPEYALWFRPADAPVPTATLDNRVPPGYTHGIIVTGDKYRLKYRVHLVVLSNKASELPKAIHVATFEAGWQSYVMPTRWAVRIYERHPEVPQYLLFQLLGVIDRNAGLTTMWFG